MVSGKFKSRSLAKKFVKTPGGRVVTRYEKRKPSRATCPDTGIFLHGIKHVRHVGKLSKSARRPSRAYGGVLSSSAARREIIAKARKPRA